MSYFYPSVVSTALSVFSCEQADRPASVPGEAVTALGSYWFPNMAVECSSSQHRAFALAVSIPSILTAVVGYPLAAVFVLRSAQPGSSTSRSVSTRSFFGHLSDAYQPAFFWLRSYVELRKAVLVAAVVFLHSAGAYYQSFACLGILTAALLLHQLAQPYACRELNLLQSAMLVGLQLLGFLSVVYTQLDHSYEGRLGIAGAYLALGLLLVAMLLVAIVLALRGVGRHLRRGSGRARTWNEAAG
jgi:hypothetical protein